MAKNDHEKGDQWNGEDLSIFSIDDKLLPLSARPKGTDLDDSSTLNARSSAPKKELDDDDSVTPANLRRSLTNPSISSEAASRQPELTASPGYRAAEAYVRPAPIAAAGVITSYGFDLRQCLFHLTVKAPKVADPDAPTVVFLPEYHFPRDECPVEVSSGKWEISSDEEETVLIQRLRWWHGEGEQSLRVSGVVRTHNVGERADDAGGLYDQCNQGTWSNCSIM
jgi:hypothetical protein